MGQYRAPSKQALSAALMEVGGAVFFEGIDNSIPRGDPPQSFFANITKVTQVAPIIWHIQGESHDGRTFTASITYLRPPGGSIGSEDTASISWDTEPDQMPSEIGARAG